MEIGIIIILIVVVAGVVWYMVRGQKEEVGEESAPEESTFGKEPEGESVSEEGSEPEGENAPEEGGEPEEWRGE